MTRRCRRRFGGTGCLIVPSSSWGRSGGSGGMAASSSSCRGGGGGASGDTASVSALTHPPRHATHGVGRRRRVIAAVGVARRQSGRAK